MIDDPPDVVQGKKGAAEGGVPPHTALGAGGIAMVGQLNDQLSRYSATEEGEGVVEEGTLRV